MAASYVGTPLEGLVATTFAASWMPNQSLWSTGVVSGGYGALGITPIRQAISDNLYRANNQLYADPEMISKLQAILASQIDSELRKAIYEGTPAPTEPAKLPNVHEAFVRELDLD